MTIVFLDSQRVLLTHYIPKGVNVNSVDYCKVLCEWEANTHYKQCDLRNEQIFFLNHNACSHSSEFTVAYLNELGWFIFFAFGLFA